MALSSAAVRPRAGRFERLTDSGPDMSSLHTPDGSFLQASPAALTLLKMAPEMLLGQGWPDLATPAEQPRVAAWWRSLGTGGPAQLTFEALTGDGTVVWLECTASAAMAEGRIGHVQAITRDVTRQRRQADELTRQCTELELRLSQLEQANRDLLLLAADAAHDLRAPVQVITGFAELLATREGPRLDVVSQEFLAHILAAAGNMRNLVDAVLAHSQATSAPLEPVAVDCGDLVDDVVADLAGDIDDRGARIVIDDLPWVWADRVQLRRIFQNLLANALAAVPAGRQPEIIVSARPLLTAWQLTVTDNGTGVAPGDRRRIFEPFQRAGAGDGRGTGLGLAICRAIVERHGGRIWVEAAAGGGSRFSFVLPAPQAASG